MSSISENFSFSPQEEHTVLLAYTPGLRKGGKSLYVPKMSQPKSNNVQSKFRTERIKLAKTEDSYRVAMQRMLSAYQSGRITEDQLLHGFNSTLHEFQTKMYVLGKRTMGVYTNKLTNEDRRFLHGKHSQEMKFFHNFAKDMRENRGTMPYHQRMDLYGLSAYPIYLHGVISVIPDRDNVTWLWDMNSKAEHCTECKRRHEESRERGGYTTVELVKMGLPAEKVPCGRKCRCGILPVGQNLNLRRTRPVSFGHVAQLLGGR